MRAMTLPEMNLELARCWAGALLAAGLLGTPTSFADERVPAAALTEARKVTTELEKSILQEAVKAVEDSGPLRAIVVCKYTVPEVSSAVSRKYGARVTRVALNPRNPSLGWPDAWEQETLLAFERRVAKGEKAEGLEHADVVTEPTGRYVRYMRALPMLPACTACHGPTQQMSDPIRDRLNHDYPHDRATGVAVGKVRGAVSYKKPL